MVNADCLENPGNKTNVREKPNQVEDLRRVVKCKRGKQPVIELEKNEQQVVVDSALNEGVDTNVVGPSGVEKSPIVDKSAGAVGAGKFNGDIEASMGMGEKFGQVANDEADESQTLERLIDGQVVLDRAKMVEPEAEIGNQCVVR